MQQVTASTERTDVRRGRYSASLLGTIKSHLEGLQGYEVMALELVQNADDARAESIIFDIREDALYVRNSGVFSRLLQKIRKFVATQAQAFSVARA